MSVLTATITSNGKVMPPEYELLSLQVCSEVNRIAWASLAVLDGSAADQSFAISDGTFFEPGKLIRINLRYEGKPASDVQVFEGVLVRHAVQAGQRGCVLMLDLKDSAIKMTRGRHSCVYGDKTDSQIIEDLIEKHGLRRVSSPGSRVNQTQLVQYYCSDWDFMLARAEANSLLVANINGEIDLKSIDLSGQPKQSFEFGISEIYEFEMEIDAQHQYAEVDSIAWDLESQKLTQASKAASFALKQGNLDVAAVAGKLGGKMQTLAGVVPQDPAEVQAWADASLRKSRLAMLRGSISVPGLGDIACLDLIEVAGVGKRFNGTTLVTGVMHRVDAEGWRTDVQFGLAPLPRREGVVDSAAQGQVPGVNGLQIGVVTSFDDPENLARIKVRLPLLDPQQAEVWARLASSDAGNGRGLVFRPEPDDEVIVGFFNDDPRQPVILGAMFSKSHALPEAMLDGAAENQRKGFVSRSGSTLAFVDGDKVSVLLQTPGKNQIVLDDDGKLIQLSDQHGNSITLSKDGIEFKSAKDLIFKAAGDAQLKADVNVNWEAGSNLDLKGGGNVVIKGSAVDIQ